MLAPVRLPTTAASGRTHTTIEGSAIRFRDAQARQSVRQEMYVSVLDSAGPCFGQPLLHPVASRGRLPAGCRGSVWRGATPFCVLRLEIRGALGLPALHSLTDWLALTSNRWCGVYDRCLWALLSGRLQLFLWPLSRKWQCPRQNPHEHAMKLGLQEDVGR